MLISIFDANIFSRSPARYVEVVVCITLRLMLQVPVNPLSKVLKIPLLVAIIVFDGLIWIPAIITPSIKPAG